MRGCVLILLVGVAIATSVKSLDTSISEILSGIPENERWGFLKNELRCGYSKMHSDYLYIKDFCPNEDFAVRLYKYFIDNYKIKKPFLNAPRDIICFDDGTCVDLGDTGIHPKR